MKRILVVSDTHGKTERLRELIAKNSPLSMLIFCGDGEGLEQSIRGMVGEDCELHMVRGNNDYASRLPLEEEFMLGPYRVMLAHGHRYGVGMSLTRLAEEAYARGCAYVFFGHTHIPCSCQCCGVTCLNPGSLSYPRQADRKPSFLLLEQEETGQLHIHEGRM